MNPSSPHEPAFPPAEPAPAPAKPEIAPDEKATPPDGRPPVSPDDASENAQGNEIHEEDLELSDATDARPPAGGAQP